MRAAINQWDHPPLLIYEYRQTPYADDFDGFYAGSIQAEKAGLPMAATGGRLFADFYTQMRSKYPDKIAVGAAWAGFNDSKASWSLGRRISQRCGQTLTDTMALNREYYPENRPMPFMLIATWNDYEEGTAIERGLEKCTPQSVASNAR